MDGNTVLAIIVAFFVVLLALGAVFANGIPEDINMRIHRPK